MVVHSLAYVLYIASYAISTALVAFLSSNKESYFHWIINIIFGSASYVCLFFVMWHLGTKKDKAKSKKIIENVTSRATAASLQDSEFKVDH